jgi:glycosyltransferase involved in cell wall biosynthesis
LLSAIDPVNEYKLYAKKGLFNISKRLPRFDRSNVYVKTDRFNHGIERSLGHMDIYHSPSPDSLALTNGAKIVVTVHDVIFKTFPQGHTQKTLDHSERQFREIGERATKIICCSRNTMSDLKCHFDIPDHKIDLVYQGVDKNVFYPIDDREQAWAQQMIRKKGVEGPYVLTVGTIEPRKNLPNVLYAFERLKGRGQFSGQLVIIGMKGWMSEGIEEIIRKLELQNDVRFMGYLWDRELRAFYNNAKVFVFPSFYEGFGYPIVESFCCGAPVVTSNVSSCPEVANSAAMTVDPYNPEAIAAAMHELIDDDVLRMDMIQRGFKRAQDFDFLKTARETLKVYQMAHAMEA